MLFAALGSYDTSWVEQLPNPNYGIYFMVIYLITNVLLLTNYVVAIMTDRYASLEQSRLGLFYDGIVESISEYKYDSRYGFLISNVIPFNIFSLLLAPIFFVVKNEDTLRKINLTLMRFAYLPIAIIATVIFFFMNVAMVPFAWMVALLKKFHLLLTGVTGRSSVFDLIGFVSFGWLIMAASAVLDTAFFLAHLFSS